MPKSPEEFAHLEWMGYVQPVGLIVSIPALLQAQCYVNKNIAGEHAGFLRCLPRDEHDEIVPEIRSLAEFTQRVLDWQEEDLLEIPAGGALPDELASLEVVLPQYHETLRPTHAVPTFRPKEGESCWLMLIQELPKGVEFDATSETDNSRHWNASPQAKFERLLREAQVPIGLLSNRRQLRLVYAPRGESSGHATFNVDEMIQVAGRPMFAALHMLLSSDRLFSLGDDQRLPAILENSRKYQNTVSTKLAEQVLASLYELMRGFQAANDVRKGELLREVLDDDPNHVYSGLLTVLMRLVFVMYAEDRDLMSSEPIYSNYYSVTGLFDRLRSDAGRYPDTMNQRYGGWAQLLTLFRLVHEGGQHDEFQLLPRKGYLFDPNRYPFLEGRRQESREAVGSPIPRISDQVIYRVLRNLLILDGERLSYRTLDVEQIGSVYETVMGFNLDVAEGKSIAIKPVKSHGAPTTINLEALLETQGKDRAKWLKEQSDQKITGAALADLKKTETIDELLTALDKKIAKKVTPGIVPEGAIVLQPSDERRRSGSHYTPRSLTAPIVRTTLEPILKQLVDPESELPPEYEPTREDKRNLYKGELARRVRLSQRMRESAEQARKVGVPHPSQILDLKICDPAMGSGAFLVEACRQLGEQLVQAWHVHDLLPADIPPDEDELLYARRLVAQRCLYGVDKNPMAVELAHLSLWLVTLAKDHPFTFLDHALRHGDSLVGLSRRQIIGFHWEPKKQRKFGEESILRMLEEATESRRTILEAREDVPYRDQEQRMANAESKLSPVRLIGDACVSAFFAGSKKKQREGNVDELFGHLTHWFDSGMNPNHRGPIAVAAASLRTGEHPIPPFHWEIEFPEVFSRGNGGFDGFVGNPPFLGGSKISATNGDSYRDWLLTLHAKSHGNADLVAHFFRRTFTNLRDRATMGLIATKTVSQGDTRATGLRYICKHGGVIYDADTRKRWPGQAAVIVSVIHIVKEFDSFVNPRLDGKKVSAISAYLVPSESHDDPKPLRSNANQAFGGAKIYGQGFVLSEDDRIALEKKDKNNGSRILPYIGGEEINAHPTHAFHRYVISFGNLSLNKAKQWPDLLRIIEERVKPERDRLRDNPDGRRRKKFWWHWGRAASSLFEAIKTLDEVLAISYHTECMGFAFIGAESAFSHALIVITTNSRGMFCVLQSRTHETWSRFFGSSIGDTLRYTPTDCFETFPFPKDLESNKLLKVAGFEYYDFRSDLMIRNNEGLTKTYNRFHDPYERSPEIVRLRELHAEMDRAVLRAYGWDDLAEAATCEFLLDYEEDEDETPGKKSKKKKPWRLRWPDEFRDEVLAQLLELNEERHKEELLLAKQSAKAEKVGKKPKRTTKRKAKVKQGDAGLFSTSLDREHRYLLVLLRVLPQLGGHVFTRRTLNAGMILMLDDSLRALLLSNVAVSGGTKTAATTLNQVFTDLEIDGFIKQVDSEHQQLWRITETAPATDDASTEDLKRVEDVLKILNREQATGNVTISEKIVDADINLIPA